MAEERDEVIKKVINLAGKIEGLGYRLDKVYLYGSFVRGSAHQYSDIDVAFISPDFNPESLEEWKTLLRLCHQIDSRIEPIFYRPDRFKDEEPLAWEIKMKGVEVPITRAA